MNIKINFAVSILLLYLFTFSVQAAESAGNITEIDGSAWAQLDDQPARLLSQGDPVYANEEIKTGEDSSIQLKMKDDSEFVLASKFNSVPNKSLIKEKSPSK